MKICQSLAVLALATSQGVWSSASSEFPGDHCCSALADDESLRGKVLAKDSEAYDARLKTYYSANSALPAWCMVMPQATQDVSRIASILTENDCPFGMRSGSHSAFELSNGVEHGVTIDFTYMNSTTYDADKKIAAIQPGSQWEAVYKALEPHGVAASGARASVVGVGGFTSGGGYTFHSNAHGFSCDAVANWEIVLANGTVVNANENENADLWKAQKGGSGNLGFVTRIDQKVVESTQMWGGFVEYDLKKRDAVFDAYINFAEKMGDDPASQEILCLYFDPTGYSMKAILTNSDAIDAAPVFEEFRAIPNVSTTADTTSIAEMVVQFAGPAPPGQYANWFTGSTTNDVRVMEMVDEKLHEYVDKMKAAAPESEFNVLIQFQPVPQSFVEHSKKQGGNMLGLEDHVADGPLLMWLIALTVDTPENQEKILPVGIEYRDAINKEAKKMGVYKDSIYLNYAWKDEDPIASFGSDNIAFLKSTSAKFDPQGAFQKLRLSGFKIPM